MDLTTALDAPTAIVGTVGAGKTFLAKVLVEKLLYDKRRVIIIDPTGVWWGLRAGADGKAKGGFPVTIFGGDHADIEIDPGKGEILAKALAVREVQAIVDISNMTGGEKVRFLTAFLRELYVLNRAALYLVVDEADEVAPQNPMPDEKVLSGAFDKIVRRGRVRGFRPLMITQRPAVLHKNVLSQIGTMIAMKLTSPQDRGAIEAWVKGNADEGQAKAVMTTISTLQRGEGWVWSPAAAILERRQFPPIITFDSSRTPEVDEIVVEPALSAVDVAQLRDAMFISPPTDEGKKMNTAAKSTQDIQKLCAEAEERGYQRGLDEGEKRGLTKGVALGLTKAQNALNALRIPEIVGEAGVADVRQAGIDKLTSLVAANPLPPKPSPAAKAERIAVDMLAAGFSAPQAKVLRSLGMWRKLGHDAPSRPMVAVMSGYSHSSGTFKNLLGQLSSAGAIEYPAPGTVRLLVDQGELTMEEAKAAFLGKLTNPQRKIADALTHGEFSREELGTATGYAHASGTFKNLLGQLSTLGIVSYPKPGRVAMAPWVFEIL